MRDPTQETNCDGDAEECGNLAEAAPTKLLAQGNPVRDPRGCRWAAFISAFGKAVSLYINTVTQPINLYGDCVRVDVRVNPQIGLFAGSLPGNLANLMATVNLWHPRHRRASVDILGFSHFSETLTTRHHHKNYLQVLR